MTKWNPGQEILMAWGPLKRNLGRWLCWRMEQCRKPVGVSWS